MSIRKRIGLLVPSTNTTAEPDFNMVSQENVTIHSQRLWNTNELTPNNISLMNTDIENACKYLATANVDIIVYACTTGSFFKGVDYDRDLISLIKSTTNLPAICTASSTVKALRFIGANKISVSTPYTTWQNERLRPYYEKSGFTIMNVDGEPVASEAGAQGHCDQEPESIYKFCLDVFNQDADALFCACTAWRSLEVASNLENRLGKPVITANQATIWDSFRLLGITNPRDGFGSLINSLEDSK